MFKGFPNPFKKAVPAAAAAPSVKKNFGDFTRKYKISKNIKNYKPVNIGKRSSLFNRGGKLGRLNTIYALDNYENNKVEGDKAVDIAKKRYQKLRGTMPLSQDDSLEMNTLYYLLKKVGNVAGLPSPTGPNASVNTYNYGNDVLVTPNSPAAPAANAGDPSGPAAAPAAAPAANNAGDPTIEGTIQRMKCTVCESQKIISNALKNGKGPAKCDMCGAKAVVPIAAPSAANMFGSTNFSTNGSRNNANKGANAAAAAKVPTAANMFGSTNFSTNGSRNNANKGANAAATPATAAQEAENAANAAAAAVEAASNAAEHPNDRNAAAQAAAAAANAARANANARAAAAAAEAARAANAAAAPASAAAPAPSAAAPPAAPAPPASRAYNPFNNRPSYNIKGINGVPNITINLNNQKVKNWDLRRLQDKITKAIGILKHLKEINTATSQDKIKLDQLEELKTKINTRLASKSSSNPPSTRKNRKNSRNTRRNTRTSRR